MTMFSLLPEKFWSRWEPLPPTALCWAEPEVVLARVTARGETRRNDLAYHQRYCEIFLDLARRFGVPVIDTSRAAPEGSLAEVVRALGVT
jgi:hypothetical protein